MSKANKKAIDLDAFLNETVGEGITIRLYGKEWKLKAEIPALFMLRLRSTMQEDEDHELSFEEELDLLRALMDPPSQVDELLAAGLSQSAFGAIIRVALASYTGTDPNLVLHVDDTESGEATGKAPMRSSSTGRTSKQT